jgi:hypothetical protein
MLMSMKEYFGVIQGNNLKEVRFVEGSLRVHDKNVRLCLVVI